MSLRVCTEYLHPVGNSQGILVALGPGTNFFLISAISMMCNIMSIDLPRQYTPGSVPYTNDLDRINDGFTKGIFLN